MRHAMKVAVAAAIVAGLGAIAGTVWIGARVKEETVVAQPYEEGLRYGAERAAREALGWDVRLGTAAPPAGPAALPFEVIDRDGRPVAGATVSLSVGRPDTSRDVRTYAARADGPGRYVADVEVPAAGPWLLRFDVARGSDRVRVEKTLHAGAACDLAASPCTRALDGGGEVTLELAPRPLRTMQDLAVRVEAREAGEREGRGAAPSITVSFSMRDMAMGENTVHLAPAARGHAHGAAVLVRCPSGRKGWTAEVKVTRPGEPPRVARFDFTVSE